MPFCFPDAGIHLTGPTIPSTSLGSTMKNLTIFAAAVFGLFVFLQPATAATPNAALSTETAASEAHPDHRPRARYYHQRVDRDINRFVRHLDHELRLNRQQERQIRRILHRRTQALLNHTRPAQLNRVYPFPRQNNRWGAYHHSSRRASQWWYTTDNRITSVLNHRQARRYQHLMGSGVYSRRGAYYNQQPVFDQQPAPRPNSRGHRRGRN